MSQFLNRQQSTGFGSMDRSKTVFPGAERTLCNSSADGSAMPDAVQKTEGFWGALPVLAPGNVVEGDVGAHDTVVVLVPAWVRVSRMPQVQRSHRRILVALFVSVSPQATWCSQCLDTGQCSGLLTSGCRIETCRFQRKKLRAPLATEGRRAVTVRATSSRAQTYWRHLPGTAYLFGLRNVLRNWFQLTQARKRRWQPLVGPGGRTSSGQSKPRTLLMASDEHRTTFGHTEALSGLPTEVFAIEVGFGVDLHGQDAQVAAERACNDALHRNSYPGLRKFLPPPGDLQQMRVHVLLGLPPEFHNRVDKHALRRLFPYGQVEVEIVPGGLAASSGIYLGEHGDRPGDDRLVIANAVITVGYNP
jgi:uncharacterized protein (TIGR02058 family)